MISSATNQSDIAVSVRGLSKSYTIAHNEEKHATLAETALAWVKNPLRRPKTETFWALKDVCFDIKRGEVVGIIGRNGAGKSTLLKILSRITDPTNGVVDLYGRVGSLLEVGTGFHPELTGRENIYLNGAILGMRRSEIARKFDAIVDFAGVEQFLDTPVKRYSSGMYVRLAFAVAAHLNPEILIIDEVLAVGDAEFQRKCLGKMEEVAKQGRTVLFVSHNIAAVEALCNTCLMMSGGQVAMAGKVSEVVEHYLGSVSHRTSIPLSARKDRTGSGRIRAVGIDLKDLQGRPISSISPDEPFVVHVECSTNDTLDKVHASIDVDAREGVRLTTLFSGFSQRDPLVIHPTGGRLTCKVENLPLRPAEYHFNVCLMDGEEVCDFIASALVVVVRASDYYGTGRLPAAVHGPLLHRYCWKSTI